MCINKKNKINILFDASLLTYFFERNNYWRSGIFFTAYNVLRELEKQQIFNITLIVRHDRYNFVHKMKTDPFFSKFTYLKIYDECQLIHREKLIKSYINNIKATSNIFLFFLYSLKILKHCLYVICYIINDNLHTRTTNKIFKKTKVFFTPDAFIYYRIKNYTHILKYIILYDIMPLLYPEYYPNDFFTNDHITEYANRRCINKEHYYFCDSECTKRDYLKFFGNILDEDKMKVMYIASSQNFYPDYNKTKLAVVLDKYKVKYKNNNKYIFSLCTLEPRKNLVFTVSCFVKFIIKHHISNLYFYLGGAQWDKFIHLLEEQIDSLDEYREKIVRLGYIDDIDVNILYSNSLFFTYISQYEGFGMPPLEAMQAGTPVITSNNSSLPEVVGDAAIMIDYDSEEQCIKAFEDLYFNGDLRKYYIEKGLERAKLFSWKKTVDKMTEVILETVKRKDSNENKD